MASLLRDVVAIGPEHFFGAQQLTATTFSTELGLVAKLTKTTGAPSANTIASDSGVLSLALAATSEVEVVTVYQNDIFPFRLDKLQWLQFNVKATGVAAASTLVWGIATTQNDAIASVTKKAWFKILGSTSTTNIVIDTNDGTNSKSNVATGTTIGTAFKTCRIDFQEGLSDVRFYLGDSNNVGQRVAAGTKFDMSTNPGDQYQLYMQIGKTSSTDAGTLQIDLIEGRHKVAV